MEEAMAAVADGEAETGVTEVEQTAAVARVVAVGAEPAVAARQAAAAEMVEGRVERVIAVAAMARVMTRK